MNKLAIGVASREVIESWVQHGVGRLYLEVVGGRLAVERVSDHQPHLTSGADTYVYLDANDLLSFHAKVEQERAVAGAIRHDKRHGVFRGPV